MCEYKYKLSNFIYNLLTFSPLIGRMFAVVELKYDIGKLLLARKDWILTKKKVYSKTEDVFCYWYSDLNDTIENMKCDYSEMFTGEPGLFKVFVVKLAGTI